MGDFFRGSLKCLFLKSACDLLPPNNRGWELVAVKGGSVLKAGDDVCFAPSSNATAYVSIMRPQVPPQPPQQILISMNVALGMPAGQQEFHWLEGTDGKYRIFLYRLVSDEASKRAQLHIEIFDVKGSHVNDYPTSGGITYPPKSDAQAFFAARLKSPPGEPVLAGQPNQDDEGTGQEPFP